MTKPNCEHIAAANLLRQDYVCYFPRLLQRQGKIEIVRPLFPRYLFVAITDRWYSIRGTRGVSHIITNDNGPAIIPQGIVESIKSRENEKGFVVLSPDRPERFSKGEKVRPTEGPFTGIDMIYEGMGRNERVEVLVNMLGQQVPIMIEGNLLVSA